MKKEEFEKLLSQVSCQQTVATEFQEDMKAIEQCLLDYDEYIKILNEDFEKEQKDRINKEIIDNIIDKYGLV